MSRPEKNDSKHMFNEPIHWLTHEGSMPAERGRRFNEKTTSCDVGVVVTRIENETRAV